MINMTMVDNLRQEESSPEARAKRVIAIRKALRLSRPKFAIRFPSIPIGTLQNWEESRFGGLSEKAAKRLVVELQSQGIECTVEWLLYGLGNPPSIIHLADSLFADNSKLFQEDKIIAQELKVFYQLNPNAVDTIITDESMLPKFALGDHVAGRRYFEKDIDAIIEQACIIHLIGSANTIVRIIQPGNQQGFYNLTCTNPTAAAHTPIIENVKLFSAAPILWIRRKGNLSKI